MTDSVSAQVDGKDACCIVDVDDIRPRWERRTRTDRTATASRHENGRHNSRQCCRQPRPSAACYRDVIHPDPPMDRTIAPLSGLTVTRPRVPERGDRHRQAPLGFRDGRIDPQPALYVMPPTWAEPTRHRHLPVGQRQRVVGSLGRQSLIQRGSSSRRSRRSRTVRLARTSQHKMATPDRIAGTGWLSNRDAPTAHPKAVRFATTS